MGGEGSGWLGVLGGLALAAPAWSAPPAPQEALEVAHAFLESVHDHGGEPGGWACRTGLARELTAVEAALPEGLRAEVAAALRPFTPGAAAPARRRLVDDTGETGDSGDRDPVGACFASEDDAAFWHLTEHFAVGYEQSGDRDLAVDFGTWLEEGLRIQVEELGWRPPDGLEDWRLPAWITREHSGGAYTSVQRCEGRDLPFIVAGHDGFSNPEWAREMASHELNHAIQFAHRGPQNFWFWEATATWMSHHSPGTQAWTWYAGGYTQHPYIGLEHSDQRDQTVFYSMYGRLVWPLYLDAHVGGPDLVRDLWAANTDRGGPGHQAALMAEAAPELDVDTLFADFVVKLLYLDLPLGGRMAPVEPVATVSGFPSQGTLADAERPQPYGTAYLAFDPTRFEQGDLHVVLTLEPSVTWLVQVIEETAGQPSAVRAVDVADDGTAVIDVPGLQDHDRVWVAASPTVTGTPRLGMPMSWTAELLNATPVNPFVFDGPADEEGCGCRTGAPGPAGALALAGLALALRRRRRGPGPVVGQPSR